jgi:hypothetical protein
MTSSAWLGHAPFAFWLIEAQRPECLVELGTLYGFSYFCFCQQVKRMGLQTSCMAVDTWAGDAHAGFYSDEVFNEVQFYNNSEYAAFSRLLRCTFDEALERVPDNSVDLLHIDGRHFYNDVKHDFESWKRKLSPRAIVLFHDTQVKERGFGVWRFWEELSREFPRFEFTHSHGLGVLGVGEAQSVKTFPIFLENTSDERRRRTRLAYEHLGYLVETNRSLRRNEECPCGSGQRYKACHGSLV